MGYFYAFFPIYFTSEAHINGSSGLLGICFFISAVSEVPFLIYADRLFDRYGAGKLMCVSALICTVRWLILAVTGNMYIALASQALHGWGFIVMTVSMAKYISATVPPELRASGQMLIAVVGFGIARVFGILGGGLISEALGGIRQGFWLMAIISGAALIVFSPMYMRRAPMNGNND
jgi:PPP family 3-phenylpropionic acid transporter